jgi:hypothetical protein
MGAALQHKVIEDVRRVDLPTLTQVMSSARERADLTPPTPLTPPKPMPPPGRGHRTHRKPSENTPRR